MAPFAAWAPPPAMAKGARVEPLHVRQVVHIDGNADMLALGRESRLGTAATKVTSPRRDSHLQSVTLTYAFARHLERSSAFTTDWCVLRTARSSSHTADRLYPSCISYLLYLIYCFCLCAQQQLPSVRAVGTPACSSWR